MSCHKCPLTGALQEIAANQLGRLLSRNHLRGAATVRDVAEPVIKQRRAVRDAGRSTGAESEGPGKSTVA